MRSIGKRYINLTKSITQRILRGNPSVGEEYIIQYLPIEMWETWEGADAEIRRIIYDEISKAVYLF